MESVRPETVAVELRGSALNPETKHAGANNMSRVQLPPAPLQLSSARLTDITRPSQSSAEGTAFKHGSAV
jgi:hypothetical protein